MSKWTPGPWDYDPEPSSGRIDVYTSRWDVMAVQLIAEASARNVDLDEALANAALLSAAPDLVEALEDLVNEIAEYNPTNINLTAARAALDKAKGER